MIHSMNENIHGLLVTLTPILLNSRIGDRIKDLSSFNDAEELTRLEDILHLEFLDVKVLTSIRCKRNKSSV
jgi:hypothetical protein